MHVVGDFLSPTMRYAFKRSWLPILRDADKVKDYNWCKYASEDIFLAIKKHRPHQDALSVGATYF